MGLNKVVDTQLQEFGWLTLSEKLRTQSRHPQEQDTHATPSTMLLPYR